MDLREEYLDWLIEQVSGYDYSDLLAFLFDVPFISILDMDRNRAEDGIDLRYRFGYEHGYSHTELFDGFAMLSDCSVLEMMVALALRCQVEIMDDMDGSDNTPILFRDMLRSLEVDHMTNGYFNQPKARYAINRFVNRQYEPNGHGGLFTIHHTNEDMRNIEIWYQLQRYLNETAFERS